MTRHLRGAVLPMLLLATWEAASRAHLVDPRLVPSPELVAYTAFDQVVHEGLLRNLAASLLRDVAGFTLGSSLGVMIGTVLGLSRIADRLFMPSFNGLRQIAILAWIPLISIWFGEGEAAKVVFIMAAALIPVVLNTHEGMCGASAKLVDVARTLTFTRWQLVTKLYLPSALPSIATGVHLALIYAWVASIGSEYFMTVGPGIGGLIIAGRERFQMDLVILGILILGLVGFLINRGASAVEARLLRWRDT
ncbi:ABC transporter permease [Acidisphaera sp. S103]|uniref:ABC transporter permease n=1 Tax=Acidisphaera sp. S103 TaxID=1747223 RepID=UPI00131BBC44|nr:ABC transporter permease [Acidisphaera sp. S103]